MDRFSGQIVDRRFLSGEAVKFNGDGVGDIRVDGPSAACGSTDEREAWARRAIRLARREDTPPVVENKEGVEVEIWRSPRSILAHGRLTGQSSVFIQKSREVQPTRRISIRSEDHCRLAAVLRAVVDHMPETVPEDTFPRAAFVRDIADDAR